MKSETYQVKVLGDKATGLTGGRSVAGFEGVYPPCERGARSRAHKQMDCTPV